ncbi:uncharacterized protein LOC144018739 [Festucalex cinctus]
MLTLENVVHNRALLHRMTFHRTMTTIGPMHLHRRSGYSLVMDKTRDLDSLSSSKECEDRAHSNVRPLFLRQRKLLLMGPKVTLLTVSRTKNVHQPIDPRKRSQRFWLA